MDSCRLLRRGMAWGATAPLKPEDGWDDSFFVWIFGIKTPDAGPIGRGTEVLPMASAVFPGPNGPHGPMLVPPRKKRGFPSLSNGRAVSSAGDLTIHRITDTHHGRTLLTLGHAAEYLTNSRRYSTREFDYAAHLEAIHLLMGASRGVFEAFAERKRLHQRFQDLLVRQAVRILERM